MPHRESKNKGQVARTDGADVFSMSQGMVTNPPISNYDFLKTRLAVQNGAKETSVTGLFNLYEYIALSSDIYAMSFEVARPHEIGETSVSASFYDLRKNMERECKPERALPAMCLKFVLQKHYRITTN